MVNSLSKLQPKLVFNIFLVCAAVLDPSLIYCVCSPVLIILKISQHDIHSLAMTSVFYYILHINNKMAAGSYELCRTSSSLQVCMQIHWKWYTKMVIQQEQDP